MTNEALYASTLRETVEDALQGSDADRACAGLYTAFVGRGEVLVRLSAALLVQRRGAAGGASARTEDGTVHTAADRAVGSLSMDVWR